VLAVEKAKLMGDITVNVRNMTNVVVNQENKHEDFESYV